MPQPFYCECGNRLKLAPEHAGRRIRCPKCQAVLTAPSIEDSPVFYEDSFEPANDVIFGELNRHGAESESGHGTLQKVLEQLCKLVEEMQATASAAAAAAAAAAAPRQKQYKVLTQKDKWFSGKFDPESIEKALNAYSQQGWSVRGVTSASIHSSFGARDELIVILER